MVALRLNQLPFSKHILKYTLTLIPRNHSRLRPRLAVTSRNKSIKEHETQKSPSRRSSIALRTHLIPLEKLFAILERLWHLDRAQLDGRRRLAAGVPRGLLVLGRLRLAVRTQRCYRRGGHRSGSFFPPPPFLFYAINFTQLKLLLRHPLGRSTWGVQAV